MGRYKTGSDDGLPQTHAQNSDKGLISVDGRYERSNNNPQSQRGLNARQFSNWHVQNPFKWLSNHLTASTRAWPNRATLRASQSKHLALPCMAYKIMNDLGVKNDPGPTNMLYRYLECR